MNETIAGQYLSLRSHILGGVIDVNVRTKILAKLDQLSTLVSDALRAPWILNPADKPPDTVRIVLALGHVEGADDFVYELAEFVKGTAYTKWVIAGEGDPLWFEPVYWTELPQHSQRVTVDIEGRDKNNEPRVVVAVDSAGDKADSTVYSVSARHVTWEDLNRLGTPPAKYDHLALMDYLNRWLDLQLKIKGLESNPPNAENGR